jgi:hypothetical protein
MWYHLEAFLCRQIWESYIEQAFWFVRNNISRTFITESVGHLVQTSSAASTRSLATSHAQSLWNVSGKHLAGHSIFSFSHKISSCHRKVTSVNPPSAQHGVSFPSKPSPFPSHYSDDSGYGSAIFTTFSRSKAGSQGESCRGNPFPSSSDELELRKWLADPRVAPHPPDWEDHNDETQVESKPGILRRSQTLHSFRSRKPGPVSPHAESIITIRPQLPVAATTPGYERSRTISLDPCNRLSTSTTARELLMSDITDFFDGPPVSSNSHHRPNLIRLKGLSSEAGLRRAQAVARSVSATSLRRCKAVRRPSQDNLPRKESESTSSLRSKSGRTPRQQIPVDVAVDSDGSELTVPPQVAIDVTTGETDDTEPRTKPIVFGSVKKCRWPGGPVPASADLTQRFQILS